MDFIDNVVAVGKVGAAVLLTAHRTGDTQSVAEMHLVMNALTRSIALCHRGHPELAVANVRAARGYTAAALIRALYISRDTALASALWDLDDAILALDLSEVGTLSVA